MAEEVYLERGARRVFACSLRWPGWCRSAREDAAALATLAQYAPRYAPVARRAGADFDEGLGADAFEVVEELTGSGSTDFGVPDAVAERDRAPLERPEAGRLADLVAASWEVLDEVAVRAPPTLPKGPRGGGRDRDAIVAHVAEAEHNYARQLGVRMTAAEFAQPGGQETLRAALLERLRNASPGEPLTPKGWPARYAARRIAWHILDHAWEIEDKSAPE